MDTILLLAFPIFVCLFIPWVFLPIIREIWAFPWRAIGRQFRFSLLTLMAVTSTLAIALGIERLQQLNAPRPMPFPVTLLFCFLLIGIIAAAAIDFRSGRSGRSSRPALHSHRDRPTTIVLPPPQPQPDAASAETKRQRPTGRRKWWLRRMPNRFRSISHRDFQATPMSGYYSNHN